MAVLQPARRAIAWTIIASFRAVRWTLRRIDGIVGAWLRPAASKSLGWLFGPLFWLYQSFNIGEEETQLRKRQTWLFWAGAASVVALIAASSYQVSASTGELAYKKSLLHALAENQDTPASRAYDVLAFDAINGTESGQGTEQNATTVGQRDETPAVNGELADALDPEVDAWLEEWKKQRERYYRPVAEVALPNANLPAPRPIRIDVETYVVQEGDTLAKIARTFDLMQISLSANNPGSNRLLKPGAELLIPPMDGLLVTLGKGETASSVAKKYGLTLRQLSAANPSSNFEETMASGTRLVVPDYGGADSVFAAPSAPTVRPKPSPSRVPSVPVATGPKTNYDGPASNAKLLWPLPTRRITQYYKFRHQALDMGTPVGTPVWASETGVVIRAGWNKGGYGYYVIIDHENGLQTLYAHNSKLLVQTGERVTRGQQIAFSGNTGRSTGPHLHYEVRSGNKKYNPLTYTR